MMKFLILYHGSPTRPAYHLNEGCWFSEPELLSVDLILSDVGPSKVILKLKKYLHIFADHYAI